MTEGRLFRWLRPWVFPAVLVGAFEWYARRAAALGSDALAPPSAAAKAFVGAALDGGVHDGGDLGVGGGVNGVGLGHGVSGDS